MKSSQEAELILAYQNFQLSCWYCHFITQWSSFLMSSSINVDIAFDTTTIFVIEYTKKT